MADYNLSYTGAQIDEKLGKVDTLESSVSNINSNLDFGESFQKNVTIGSSNTDTKETVLQDIADDWSTIPVGIGMVRYGNATTIYHGTYQKYNDTTGCVLLTRMGTNTTYSIEMSSSGNSIEQLVTEAALNEKLTETDWNTLLQDGNGVIQYKKKNGFVIVKCLASSTISTVANEFKLLGMLPDGYRPESSLNFPAVWQSATTSGNVFVNIDSYGYVYVWSSVSASYWTCTCTFTVQ